MKSFIFTILFFISFSVSAGVETFNFNSIKDARKPELGTVSMNGVLYIPDNITDKIPVIILLHGAGGIDNNREPWYAQKFKDLGIAAMFIDVFKPRDIPDTVTDQSKLVNKTIGFDAYNALVALSKDPRFDKSKIGVMGFSRGAIVSMNLYVGMWRDDAKTSISGLNDIDFAFYVPFYPACNIQLRKPETNGKPALFVVGERDNYTEPKPCIEYVNNVIKDKSEIYIVKNANHAWELTNGVKHVSGAEKMVGCVYVWENNTDKSVSMTVDRNENKLTSPIKLNVSEAAEHIKNNCRGYGANVGSDSSTQKDDGFNKVIEFIRKYSIIK